MSTRYIAAGEIINSLSSLVSDSTKLVVATITLAIVVGVIVSMIKRGWNAASAIGMALGGVVLLAIVTNLDKLSQMVSTEF